MKTKKRPSLFDLNVEKILDHWDVPEAIREVIANALDEAALTSTVEPEIVKRRDGWHVIDSGRGLRYQHLTQNENPEKRRQPPGLVLRGERSGVLDPLQPGAGSSRDQATSAGRSRPLSRSAAWTVCATSSPSRARRRSSLMSARSIAGSTYESEAAASIGLLVSRP